MKKSEIEKNKKNNKKLFKILTNISFHLSFHAFLTRLWISFKIQVFFSNKTIYLMIQLHD
jgi:hypothetical protein